MRVIVVTVAVLMLTIASACAAEGRVTSDGVPYLELLEAHLERPNIDSNVELLAIDCGQINVWIQRAGRDGEIVDAICKKAAVDREWERAGEMTREAYPLDYER